MVQNPSASNETQRPDSQELLDIHHIRNEVDLAYEPINSIKSGGLREEVGQTIVDAAARPSYLDQLAASGETESMSPEQKLLIIGTNIQAMRRNALKEGTIDGSAAVFSKSSGSAGSDYAEAA